MMFEALDVVRTNFGCEMMTIISCERGCEPNKYYCINKYGNVDWFHESELKIATTNDSLIKHYNYGKGD